MANNDNSCANEMQLFDEASMPVLAVYLVQYIMKKSSISFKVFVCVTKKTITRC